MGPRSYARNGSPSSGIGKGLLMLQWGRAVTRGTGEPRRLQEHPFQHASMGPRSYARNGPMPGEQAGHGSSASMGPRSYARNGPSARRNAMTLKRLQWGRAVTRGTGRDALAAVRAQLAASMGPRSYARNGVGGALRLWASRCASMGPRSYARNGCTACARVTKHGRLQWGRAVTRGTGQRLLPLYL